MPTAKVNFECWLVSNIPYLKGPPFYQTLLFHGEVLNFPTFLGKFQKREALTFYKEGRAGFNYALDISATMLA